MTVWFRVLLVTVAAAGCRNAGGSTPTGGVTVEARLDAPFAQIGNVVELDEDRVAFTGRASGPMRVSIQVRSSATARRWIRSVYLSDRAAPVTIALREMTPGDPTQQAPLDLAGIDAILVVVDTVNTSPGSSGEVWISELRVEGTD